MPRHWRQIGAQGDGVGGNVFYAGELTFRNYFILQAILNFYKVGGAMQTGAWHLPVMVIGRVLSGFGLGLQVSVLHTDPVKQFY